MTAVVVACGLFENPDEPKMEIRICREIMENEVTSSEMR